MSMQPNMAIYQIGGGLIYSDSARAGRDDTAEIKKAMAERFLCNPEEIGEETPEPAADEWRITYITVRGTRRAYYA